METIPLVILAIVFIAFCVTIVALYGMSRDYREIASQSIQQLGEMPKSFLNVLKEALKKMPP